MRSRPAVYSYLPARRMLYDQVMRGGFDRTKPLQELEQHDWGEPSYDSYHVTTIHRLRRKPDFTVEDLRIMIGQQIGLPFLVPIAVERVEAQHLTAGDCYPGDLLSEVLSISEGFWLTHPDSLARSRRVSDRVPELVRSLDETDRRIVDAGPDMFF